MESLIYLLAFTGVVTGSAVYYNRNRLDRNRLIALGVAGPLVVILGYGAVMFHNRVDVEVWNGEVTKKYSEVVPCTHYDTCNCRSDGKGGTTCDQCPRYAYEQDWVVENTAGDKIEIDRVDEPGYQEPPRFTQVKIGEPVSQTHFFVNYVMGARDSLFNTKDQKKIFEQFKSLIPSYPDDVFDYYRLNHLVTSGNVHLNDLERSAWNQQLALMLRSLGPRKQVNVILVLTSSQDANFANALRTAWLGGKKNDVVVVVGTSAYPKVDWVRVVSWTDNQAFKIQLADALQDQTLDPQVTTTLIGGWINRDFSRKHMKDFGYLAWESAPSVVMCILLALLSVAATALAAYLTHNTRRHRRRFH